MMKTKKHWLSSVIEPVEVAQKRAIGSGSVVISMGSRKKSDKDDFGMRVKAIKIVGNCLKELVSLVRKYKLLNKHNG